VSSTTGASCCDHRELGRSGMDQFANIKTYGIA
jgi:hypothetical protein